MLPARQGDAIWLKWGQNTLTHQMLIDMGTKQVGMQIREELGTLDKRRAIFELLVITHVDGDHIGGCLSCLSNDDSAPLPLFKDIWFNGWVHLSGGQVRFNSQQKHLLDANNDLESYGPVQGEIFSQWLGSRNWNKAFKKSVCRNSKTGLPKVILDGGLKITVLGPTPERLSELRPKWKEEVENAIKKGRLERLPLGLESYGSALQLDFELEEDLKMLAETVNDTDKSKANGTSIILLLEHQGVRILLSGDAYASDIIHGLSLVNQGERIRLDAFKLPHHGSKKYFERISGICQVFKLAFFH